jgi:hypothetical protein
MKRNLNPFLIPLALCALIFSVFGPLPARAQQVIRLQTISATLANNATCTGSEQDFTTSQGITGFQNIGQTSHLATATSNAAQFSMEIDGKDNSGNVFRLSPVQVGAPTNAKSGYVVAASGYMTNIQVAVTCTSGATFTASYTGSFSPIPPDIGGALLTAIDKLPFQTAAANANASNTFQSPTGSSGGTIVFQYAATGPSGSTIGVQCISNAGSDLSLTTFSPVTGTSPQLFTVTPGSCPFVDVTYTSGGASATTYTLEYVFSSSGVPGANGDPCLSPNAVKMTAAIGFNSSSSDTWYTLAGTAGKSIYVCAFNIYGWTSSSTASVALGFSSVANCSSGQIVANMPTFTFGTAPTSVNLSGPSLFAIPYASAPNGVLQGPFLCMELAGTPAAIDGMISYVNQ